jgi:hypothetical protein
MLDKAASGPGPEKPSEGAAERARAQAEVARDIARYLARGMGFNRLPAALRTPTTRPCEIALYGGLRDGFSGLPCDPTASRAYAASKPLLAPLAPSNRRAQQERLALGSSALGILSTLPRLHSPPDALSSLRCRRGLFPILLRPCFPSILMTALMPRRSQSARNAPECTSKTRTADHLLPPFVWRFFCRGGKVAPRR